MYCIRKVTDDVTWIGADDRRLAMFEGVYSVPRGVSYNSYLLLDEKTVLFDTVDKAVGRVFFENLAQVLAGRPLDYVIVQHMELIIPRRSRSSCCATRRRRSSAAKNRPR
jgi:flavorubredoxin